MNGFIYISLLLSFGFNLLIFKEERRIKTQPNKEHLTVFDLYDTLCSFLGLLWENWITRK